MGPAVVLHMPGELFVEYQLAAQRMRPDRLVCMAAYGDYGPGYIGTEIAYSEGGYETGEASRVAPSEWSLHWLPVRTWPDSSSSIEAPEDARVDVLQVGWLLVHLHEGRSRQVIYNQPCKI
jgi:hypothetical protein